MDPIAAEIANLAITFGLTATVAATIIVVFYFACGKKIE